MTRVAQRLRGAIAEPIELNQAGGTGTAVMVGVTASIGVAVTTDHPTDAALIHTADTAMYRAKNTDTGIVATAHLAPVNT